MTLIEKEIEVITEYYLYRNIGHSQMTFFNMNNINLFSQHSPIAHCST